MSPRDMLSFIQKTLPGLFSYADLIFFSLQDITYITYVYYIWSEVYPKDKR